MARLFNTPITRLAARHEGARAATIAGLVALVVAGCGGGSQTADAPATATNAPSPSVTATATASATPTATATATTTATATATPTATPTGESGQGGGGDEASARIPVAVTVGSDGTVAPSRISVPAFFTLELRVRNRTAGAISVSWTGSQPSGSFQVGAGQVSSRLVTGVKPGEYPLAVAGAGTATIVSGAQPGP